MWTEGEPHTVVISELTLADPHRRTLSPPVPNIRMEVCFSGLGLAHRGLFLVPIHLAHGPDAVTLGFISIAKFPIN